MIFVHFSLSIDELLSKPTIYDSFLDYEGELIHDYYLIWIYNPFLNPVHCSY